MNGRPFTEFNFGEAWELSCVYAILCENRIYVGETGNLYKRFYLHITDMEANRHLVKDMSFHWLFKRDKFEYLILEKTNNEKERKKLEMQWIKSFDYDIPPDKGVMKLYNFRGVKYPYSETLNLTNFMREIFNEEPINPKKRNRKKS